MFITPERKISTIEGTGVQYIPGHVENFIDFVIENYLPDTGNILDLGGGGLRFAIPAALRGKAVTVVDLDASSLDVESIVAKVNQNGKLNINCEAVQKLIQVRVQDVLSYLEESKTSYHFISAFRVIHFFSPDLLSKFFSLIHKKLENNGILVLSAIVPYNTSETREFNELYLNSENLDPANIYYRRFKETLEAENTRTQQNLPEFIHMIDRKFMDLQAQHYGFDVIEKGLQSTRVVEGYILKKLLP
jgi:SAM-dependent methyltransferase